MKLLDRYPNTPGVRLDTGANDNTGPAVDLHGRLSRRHPNDPGARLWVRESGGQEGKQAELPLDVDAVRALRDGATRMLVEAGYEREVTVTVPR